MASFLLPCGRRMAYALSSASSRPVVLLSNSLCEDYTSWDRVVPVLESLGYAALRYDQPGHGGSDSPPSDKLAQTTFEGMADDVALLLQHLGITRLRAWIGVSMGGIKGLYFAALHPGIIQTLVVSDAIAMAPTVVGTPDVFSLRVAAAHKAGSMDEDLVSVRKRWFGDAWMAQNPEETARMTVSMATTTVAGLEACCAALSNPSFDLRKHYASVGGGCDEALLIAGEKDANLPVQMEEMRQAVEESLVKHDKPAAVKLKIITSAGHVPYIDGFDEFCSVLKQHLKD